MHMVYDEAVTPILWPPDVKNWLIGKDPDAGKDWRQEKGITEDEMVGWYHRLDGHEFEETPGVGDGQRSLVCCSPWGLKESDTTEWLNRTDVPIIYWSNWFRDFPSGPPVKNPPANVGTRVHSLAGERRSHLLHHHEARAPQQEKPVCCI